MKFPLISVIVPAYNSEKVIERCIRSLLNQTFKNYIIYIINDGSQDGTKEKLAVFRDNPKVIIINQKNMGVSGARNKALIHVESKYVAFVDSDDYLDKDYLLHLYHGFVGENIDLVIEAATGQLRKENIGKISSLEIMNLLLKKQIGGFLWNKLFRAAIIKKNNLVFDKDLYIGEDLNFCERYLMFSNEVNVIDYRDYHYSKSSESASNKGKLSNYDKSFFDGYLCTLNRTLVQLPDKYVMVKKNIDAEFCSVACDYIRLLRISGDLKKARKISRDIKEKGIPLSNNFIFGPKRKLVMIMTIYLPFMMNMIDKYGDKRR